jgi:hypothetical protein
MPATVELTACSRAPITNNPSAARITRFRPNESARRDAKGETSSAKREVHEVMMDLSREVSALLDNEVPIDTSVAEMTPVSSSKSQPGALESEMISERGQTTYIQTTTR